MKYLLTQVHLSLQSIASDCDVSSEGQPATRVTDCHGAGSGRQDVHLRKKRGPAQTDIIAESALSCTVTWCLRPVGEGT